MATNYADGLSPYENKGVLGAPEKFEDEEKVNEKCEILAEWIKNAKHIVVHTGAGISTSAGIPDFRGPNGVWTLEKEGKKPEMNISFDNAKPTQTHMALKYLLDKNIVQYIVSQNIDGLHLKSGVNRTQISELHGNMFTEQCNVCESQFVRHQATTSVGKKLLGGECRRALVRGRVCRGKLHDTILDWEHNLPSNDLDMADYQSSLADLNICLGTTLQILPSGALPIKNKKYGGKVVIVNLQPTKFDKKADLIINSYVDKVMEVLMEKLGFKIPTYSSNDDPIINPPSRDVQHWNIAKSNITKYSKMYTELNKDFKKRRREEQQENTKKKMKKEMGSEIKEENDKKKVKKEEIKEELVKEEP
ncbi:unnamed protein product [Brassicogethes aeneus]|uniref:protein acetyllysine N-acetyltransferase n=1 Tax=Brassicogethes aeneus TaxID=1431903 RepID=A0A9P0FGT5_BRAAE|nr:unnamed protein product [Brassicogethes aeneus]